MQRQQKSTNQASPELQRFIKNLVDGNPEGVMKLAYKHGYFPPSDKSSMERLVFSYISRNGDNAFKDLAYIHPDRELLLSTKNYNWHLSHEVNDADGGLYTSIKEPVSIKKELKNLLFLVLGAAIVLYILRDKV